MSNTQKCIVRRDTCADQARDRIGKGRPDAEQEGEETQEEHSATGLTVSASVATGLVSRLSLASHSDSGSFLVAQVLLSQDGFQHRGFWEVARHLDWSLLSPFDPSQILPVRVAC